MIAQLWWALPTIITLAGIVAAVLAGRSGGTFTSTFVTMMLLIPALGVSVVAWIIGAACK